VIDYLWRGALESAEVESLHAAAFGHDPVDHDWAQRLERHSLGWVTAREAGRLVGFVNVAWDGAEHAFLIDTIVAADRRRRGIGAELIRVATDEARRAGCDWLHADFDDHLTGFYLEACGFGPTPAGLIDLSRSLPRS
jgi:GNAT superfamily N-acetyltransferase